MRLIIGFPLALGFFMLGVTLAPSTACADRIDLDAGLTINVLDGIHDTGTAVERLTFIPLPLGEINARYRHTTLHREGIAPIAFAYGSDTRRLSTHLSIVNIALRQFFTGGAFIGLGQTVYNQLTFYPSYNDGDVASQGSRVTGARLEAGIVRPVVGATHVEFVFAVNPAMRGVEKTQLRIPHFPEIDYPERAVQVDSSLRFVTSLRHGDVIYGLRYLNYASRFDRPGTRFDELLADRNVGYLPLVGYRVRF